MTQTLRIDYKPIVISLCAALILYVSFLLGAWHFLDRWIAFNLNGLVTKNQTQQWLWSLANLRAYDKLVGMLMVALAVFYVVYGDRYNRTERLAQFFVMSVCILALSSFSHSVVFEGLDRDSPSLVLQPFTILSQLNDLGAKSTSTHSYPSDHGTITAIYAYFMWAWAGRRFGIAALVLAIIACVPRLVSGAHWLTDVAVGSIASALFVVPLIVFTPVGNWSINAMAGLFRRFWALFGIRG